MEVADVQTWDTITLGALCTRLQKLRRMSATIQGLFGLSPFNLPHSQAVKDSHEIPTREDDVHLLSFRYFVPTNLDHLEA